MNDNAVRIERRAKRFWVTFIVTLLSLQVAIGAVSIYLATGDNSVAVVPDYHRAAMNWDDTKQERQAAVNSGWDWQLTASDVADGRGMRAVELVIRDIEQNPIDELMISGQTYHHALASATHSIQFQSAGDGRYIALAPMQRGGLWQVDLEIVGGDRPMTTTQTLELNAANDSGDHF